MGQTVVQKILARATGRREVAVGEVVEPRVDLAMSHENAALVIAQFNEIFRGLDKPAKVWDPERIALIFDHRVPAESSKTATNQAKVRRFAADQGIRKFHDIRGDEGGICHQVLPENGYVLPGRVVVGTDSHTTTHGALGAFAFGIGATEMAAVWALGSVLNVETPDSIKVTFEGDLPAGVSAKDLALYLVGELGADGANFHVLEFHGDTIAGMSTSGRMTLANMAVEAGATCGIVPADAETQRYLKEEAGLLFEPEGDYRPDADARYGREMHIRAEELEPQLACPHRVDHVKPVREEAGRAVDQIVIGSCTNGRLDDLEEAAAILRGRKVARNVRLLVFPATWRIYREAMKRGYIAALIDAGAVVMNPGCGCCLGVHQGALGDGEVALSTTNRNFKGRMGNANAEIYLCSPAVAAVSAIRGVITDPREVM